MEKKKRAGFRMPDDDDPFGVRKLLLHVAELLGEDSEDFNKHLLAVFLDEGVNTIGALRTVFASQFWDTWLSPGPVKRHLDELLKVPEGQMVYPQPTVKAVMECDREMQEKMAAVKRGEFQRLEVYDTNDNLIGITFVPIDFMPMGQS